MDCYKEADLLTAVLLCTCFECAASTGQSNDSSQAAEQLWDHDLVLHPRPWVSGEQTAGGASCTVSMHHWRTVEQQQRRQEAN